MLKYSTVSVISPNASLAIIRRPPCLPVLTRAATTSKSRNGLPPSLSLSKMTVLLPINVGSRTVFSPSLEPFEDDTLSRTPSCVCTLMVSLSSSLRSLRTWECRESKYIGCPLDFEHRFLTSKKCRFAN